MSGNLSLPRRNRPPRGRSSAFPSRCRSCRRSRPERRGALSPAPGSAAGREKQYRYHSSFHCLFLLNLNILFVPVTVLPGLTGGEAAMAPAALVVRDPEGIERALRALKAYLILYSFSITSRFSRRGKKNNSSVITNISRTEPAEFFAQFFLGFFQKPLAISIGMCYNNSVNHESLSCAQLRAAI